MAKFKIGSVVILNNRLYKVSRSHGAPCYQCSLCDICRNFLKQNRGIGKLFGVNMSCADLLDKDGYFKEIESGGGV